VLSDSELYFFKMKFDEGRLNSAEDFARGERFEPSRQMIAFGYELRVSGPPSLRISI
jgi:hypothetical protein